MEPQPPPVPEDPVTETPHMPRWVPVLVAAILVVIAALAVYTGMRYRRSPLDHDAKSGMTSRQTSQANGGSPGEPEAGGSRVLPGDSGDNAPAPSAQPFPQQSRVALRGGAEGVRPTYRTSARRGVQLVVQPATALLYVNDQAIGPVDQYSKADEIYEFPEEGNFTFRLVAPGHHDVIYMITADPEAKDEIAKIDITMDVVKAK